MAYQGTKDGIIEAAYEAGFEPSTDNLTLSQLHAEATEYLSNTELKN